MKISCKSFSISHFSVSNCYRCHEGITEWQWIYFHQIINVHIEWLAIKLISDPISVMAVTAVPQPITQSFSFRLQSELDDWTPNRKQLKGPDARQQDPFHWLLMAWGHFPRHTFHRRKLLCDLFPKRFQKGTAGDHIQAKPSGVMGDTGRTTQSPGSVLLNTWASWYLSTSTSCSNG